MILTKNDKLILYPILFITMIAAIATAIFFFHRLSLAITAVNIAIGLVTLAATIAM